MNALVWVDSWQMQCCGDPFRVGDSVDWTAHDAIDRDWLANCLTPQLAAAVTHAEEHHQDEQTPQPLRGIVTGIRSAYCAYAPQPGDPRTLYPVPGSCELEQLDHADGSEAETPTRTFTGYLVDIALTGQ
jgi:hypothetical protein